MPEAQHFWWVVVRVEVHISVGCRVLVRERRERKVVAIAVMVAYWPANLL